MKCLVKPNIFHEDTSTRGKFPLLLEGALGSVDSSLEKADRPLHPTLSAECDVQSTGKPGQIQSPGKVLYKMEMAFTDQTGKAIEQICCRYIVKKVLLPLYDDMVALYNLDLGNAFAGSKPHGAGFLAVEMCFLLLSGKQDGYKRRTLAVSEDELLVPIAIEE
ncbi:hypothetical protein AAES_151927 [Amazona aestiva]|uniref:Uncharacterized protein n=1 Tax=Amazona aestiva TaxID=12930 RepID=A0A0Q3UQ56_AMAAE|nr:hypothetical protein AAES_151927 [Amazona aestiva]